MQRIDMGLILSRDGGRNNVVEIKNKRISSAGIHNGSLQNRLFLSYFNKIIY